MTSETPRHCGPGVPAPCGCLWEGGAWFLCVAHSAPHSLHETPCPACDLCDSALDDCCDGDTYDPSLTEESHESR